MNVRTIGRITKVASSKTTKMRNVLTEDLKMPRIIFCIALFVLIVSCSEGLVKSDFQATNSGSWVKDDIVELFIDEAAKILAGDIESFNQVQTAEKGVESNN